MAWWTANHLIGTAGAESSNIFTQLKDAFDNIYIFTVTAYSQMINAVSLLDTYTLHAVAAFKVQETDSDCDDCSIYSDAYVGSLNMTLCYFL